MVRKSKACRSRKARLPAALAGAVVRFARYRRVRRVRGPLDEGLWSLAVELAGEHGLNRTARALGLDYYSLKKRLGEGGEGGTGAAVDFIECLPAEITRGTECVIELDDGSGGKLRMHLRGAGSPDLAGIAFAFRRGGS